MSPMRPVPDVAPVQVLKTDGFLLEDQQPGMPDEEVLEALELMTLSRTFDDRAFSLQRQGRFGTFSQVSGQEAAVVGAASALDPARDWVVPQYRELPALLRQGLPLERFMLTFTGHPAGGAIPAGVNILPIQISLAAQYPHAVGLAWGLRHQGSDGVVLAFIGDGASSEGDFHESLNLAGVRRAPVVFLLQNNEWAISTPRSAQTAAATFADRALGYGIPGVVVDGNDLLAVHQVTAEAVGRARAGEGPTLIEAQTYRMGPHNTADDPTRYTDNGAAEAWTERDPVERIRRYLAGRGRWDDAIAEELQVRCNTEVDRALDAMRAVPAPGPEDLFDHVYAEPPARLVAQRQAWVERS